MGCIISIIATVVRLSCSMPPQDGAAVLIAAPGLSNRTNVYTPTLEDLRPRVVTVASAPAAPKVTPETDTSRAIRMGIPGGYTPLEWAILNGGR